MLKVSESNMVISMRFTLGLSLLLSAVFSLSVSAEDGFERFTSQSQIEDLNAGLGGAGTILDPLPLPRMALELIKHFEGWEPVAYNDPNYCTIGYGHLIALKKCEEIELGRFSEALSVEKGEELLKEDTKTARQAVLDFVDVSLDENQYGALSSFVFNVGKGSFTRSTLLDLVNRGEFDLAADEFQRWVYSGGQMWRGLQIRRQCEMAMFVGAIPMTTETTFSREMCGKSLGASGAPIDYVDIEIGE